MIRALLTPLLLGVFACAGCDSLFGIGDHELATDAPTQEPFTPSPGGASHCDSSVDASDSSLLFCDGFENGLTQWTPSVTDGGVATRDTTQVYRGKYALHAHLPAAAATNSSLFATLQHSEDWPMHVYVRFFAYVTSPWITTALDLLSLVGESGAGLTLFLTGGEPPRVAAVTFAVPSPVNAVSTTAVPLEAWSCFAVEIDTVQQVVHVSLNDMTIADLTVSAALEIPGLLQLGLDHTSALNAPYDAWFDELAVSTNPISCDQ